MDKISTSLKCVFCTEILLKPVTLPCGHSICQKHTETNNERITCAQCGSNHLNKGFCVSEALEKIIASQLASLDFGNVHKEARSSCAKLRDVLDRITLVLKDPNFYTHEEINELKNRIVLKNEEFKFKLEEATQKLLDSLEKYNDNCKQYLNSVDYEKNANIMLEARNEAEKELEERLLILNEIKLNESDWKQIQADTDQKCNDLKQKLNEFQQQLLLERLEENKRNINMFEKINVDSIFENL